MKMKKKLGKTYSITIKLAGEKDLIEEGVFSALEVMKSVQHLLLMAKIDCLAFNFVKDDEPLMELLYESDKIVNMDFNNVDLKTFIDESYRFRTTTYLAEEVQAIHEQLRQA